MADKPKKITVLKIGKKPRKSSGPRPHLRTNRACLANQWTKGDPRIPNGRKIHAERVKRHLGLVTAALHAGLEDPAVADGKVTDHTVAEIIAAAHLEQAMNGDVPSTNLVLERTEGKVSQEHHLAAHVKKEITFRVVFDEPSLAGGS